MRTEWLEEDAMQLELDLFPGVPWGGRSPRGLTRVKYSLFLRQKPPGHEVYVDPSQLEMWPVSVQATKRKKAPIGSADGAPSLLPLKKGRRSRSFASRFPRGGSSHGET